MGAVKMRTTTEMELVSIEKLIPYVNNARTHSPAQITKLRSSLREFGFINPVIIDRDFNVIAGHGRIMAAKEEGIKEVPCVFADYLTEAQKKAYIIADNRMAMDAGWDEELLRVEIEALQGMDFDPSLTGFDEKELATLFNNGIEAKDDDFDVSAELEKPTITHNGDVWILGKHRLVCGDSTKAETFEALMQGEKANLVITDPPYNVNYEGSAGKIKNDNMADEKFYNFLKDAFTNTEAAMSDDASIYVFHADTEGLNFRKAFQDSGFYLSGTCIWKKQSLVLGRSPYQWQHEPILFGWKKKGKHQWYTGRKESTIWEFDKPKKNADHPTMKPIPLLAYPIVNSSMTNCIVLDPFGGSGSTLIACQQTDRICRTIELDEKFCDVIVKRYIEQVGLDDEVKVIRDNQTIPFKEIHDDGEEIPQF
jgi:DNA modification methylase